MVRRHAGQAIRMQGEGEVGIGTPPERGEERGAPDDRVPRPFRYRSIGARTVFPHSVQLPS